MALLASLLLLSLNILVINRHVHVCIDSLEEQNIYSAISSNSGQFSRLILFTNTMFTLIHSSMILIIFLLSSSVEIYERQVAHCQRPQKCQQLSPHKSLKNGGQLLVTVNCFLSVAFSLAHSCVLILKNRKLN